MTFRTLLGPRDPRVFSGLLARKTLKQLEESPHDIASDPVALIILNFVRLLEMYRFNVMHTSQVPAGILQSVPLVLGDQEFDEDETDPLQDVEKAFEAARVHVFTNPVLNRDAAATKVKATLSWHLKAAEEKPTAPPDADINETREFLRTFLDTLAKPA